MGSGALWAIVLAGGEGRRLASLTRSIHGVDIPKQFARVLGDRTLLAMTLERTVRVVPESGTLVVAPGGHADRARREMLRFPAARLILQPRNLGTGPGLQLPLAHLRVLDPEAHVAVFPCDHHVSDPDELVATVREADRALDEGVALAALIGAEPDTPETSYGWIVPGARLGSATAARSVARFVEKPSRSDAERLMGEGALWNTFLLVARLKDLWRLFEECLPAQTRLFEAVCDRLRVGDATAMLDLVYAGMPPADFSRDVLSRARGLAVLALQKCSWIDVGTPDRAYRARRERAGGAQGAGVSRDAPGTPAGSAEPDTSVPAALSASRHSA